MLILTRRTGESLMLSPSETLDLDMSVRELFAEGPFAITVLGTKGNQVRIGIAAPYTITVLREELIGSPPKAAETPIAPAAVP